MTAPTDEKWPEIVLARRLDAPQLGHWETEQTHADAHGMDSERYVPLETIRARLLSDEAVEAAAEATYKLVEGSAGAWIPWDSLSRSERSYWIDGARVGHEAAIAAAFKEEHGDQRRGHGD